MLIFDFTPEAARVVNQAGMNIKEIRQAPVFDLNSLQELGISEHEAKKIMKTMNSPRTPGNIPMVGDVVSFEMPGKPTLIFQCVSRGMVVGRDDRADEYPIYWKWHVALDVLKNRW